MNSRLVEIEKNLGIRCNQIERKLNAKVDLELFSQLQEKVDKLEKLIKTNEEAALRENLSKEAYSKQFNLIIHGIEEEKNVAWEGREKQKDCSMNSLQKVCE